MVIFSLSLTNFLQLRLCLIGSCICFALYTTHTRNGIKLDMALFNLVTGLLNIQHAVVLVYRMRYIEFSEELEQIYTKLFSLYMTRVQFGKLSKIAVIRHSKANVIMKEEGDFVTSLCIIVKGHVDVKRKGRRINVLFKNEILEAPD
jgi:hypothetical protein